MRNDEKFHYLVILLNKMVFEIDSLGAYSGSGTAMLSQAGIMSTRQHKAFYKKKEAG